MAASSEQIRHAQSVISFMELCADIHPSLRRTIANSKAFRTFVLDLSQEASTENVALFKEAHEKCAAIWKGVLEEKHAEKKRKELEGSVNPCKRTKLSYAADKDIREPLEAGGQTILRASPSTNEQSASHAAGKNILPSSTDSDNSLFVPKKIAPVIHGAICRDETLEDEAYVGTPDNRSDTEASYEPSDSRESTITQDIQPPTKIHGEDSDASPHTKMINTGAQLVKSLRGARGNANSGSASIINSTPADNHTTQKTAESMSQAANISSAASGRLVMTNGSLRSDLELKITKELGITFGSPAIVAPLKEHFLLLPEWSSHRHRDCNIDDILDIFTRFNFDIVKHKLLQYLGGRPRPTGSETPATPIPSIWNMYEAVDIVNALQIMGSTDKHAKIHRAYAQLKLYAMVEAKAAGALVVKGAGKHVSEHLIHLEDLAKERAGTVAMQDTMEKRYTAAYYAGKRWSELVGWFGGGGSVLILVTLGIGNSYVESGWNDFQRACFEYIARDLFSIKKLVRKMGDGVLEQYCRFGNLTDDQTNEIRGVEGYC